MSWDVNTASTTALPSCMSLDGEWDFTYTIQPPVGDAPTAPDADAFDATMAVPGRWDDHTDRISHAAFWSKARFNPYYRPACYPLGPTPPDASLPYLLGTGWYRGTFQTEADLHHTLEVGGVCLEAWVWMNGTFVKHHQGHSCPFMVELTASLLRVGENELIIAVANTREDRLGCDLRGYKGKSGGITDTCRLWAWRGARIRDCYLHADAQLATLHWRLEVDQSESLEPLRVRCRLRDRHGNPVTECEAVVTGPLVRAEMDAASLPRWSDRDPHLLTAEAELLHGSECLYQHRQPFGLRRLTRDGIGLRLNGVPTYLRGVTEHAYFPETCTPPRDIRFYRRIIRRFKSLGFNWLRFHTWVPPQGYLDAADELGMLIQVEPPVNFSDDEWLAILRHCRRHPSVVIYCAGNEERLDETKIAQLETCAQRQKEHVPDALFNPQEALRGVEYHWRADDTGLADHPFPHHPARLDKLKQFADLFGTYSWGKLSYSSAEADISDIDQRLALYERPCLSHEITIHGSYLNLELQHRYDGTRIGGDIFASARELLHRSGRLHRAFIYYRNSAALQAEEHKHAVESARRCHRLSGYNMLGAIDAHWHRSGYACGMMNEFYELKGEQSPADVRRYNGESVLLCDLPNRRNLVPGQTVRWPALVSLFGVNRRQPGELRWHVTDATDRIIATGANKATAEPGGLTTVGAVNFTAPAVDRPQRFTLHMRFDAQTQMLDNNWPLWVVPDERPAMDGRVCRELDEATIARLEKGADALLLGSDPLPSADIRFQQALAGRPTGHMGTVVEQHPLTKQLPHDGWCDRFFFDMMNGSKAVVMDGLLDRFEPIIEVIGSYKQSSAFAALFESRIGRGRLLVCTFNLRQDDPGARWLTAAMQRYVDSNAFKPATNMLPGTLRQALANGTRTVSALNTDKAFDERAQIKGQ